MLLQTARQFYQPIESPYEDSLGGLRPNDAYPSEQLYPSTTAEPGFTLGQLAVELPGCYELLCLADVFYRRPLKDLDAQQGIITGDIQEVNGRMIDFFHQPTEFYPLLAYPVDDRLLTVTYRDYAAKHPDLRQPYQLTIIVEYAVKHPEIEALTDAALRDRIYADLLNSDFTCISIDVEKYRADPAYSAVAAIREAYRHFFEPGLYDHPSVEALILNSVCSD